MKLDRNLNADGTGKYALFHMRKYRELTGDERHTAFEAGETLRKMGLLQFGDEGPGEQFFVMKYKDRFAGPALHAYARAVLEHSAAIFPMDLQCRATWPDVGDEPLSEVEARELKRLRREVRELKEFAVEMLREASRAVEQGVRIPD